MTLFDDLAIKELAAILAHQEACRTAQTVRQEMDTKSADLADDLKATLETILDV